MRMEIKTKVKLDKTGNINLQYLIDYANTWFVTDDCVPYSET